MKNPAFTLEKITNSKALPFIFLAVFLILHTQGYCAPSADDAEVAKGATSFVNTLHSWWVRTIVLAVSFFWGWALSMKSGGFVPLMTIFGLGLCYNFSRSLIDFLTR